MRKKTVLIISVVLGVLLFGVTLNKKTPHKSKVIITPAPIMHTAESSLQSILHQEAITLNAAVLDKALTALACASQSHLEHTSILTIIDYSLPSSQKRMWVFDLDAKKVLFNTYVAHGLNSGARFSNYFSNKNNSKASSIGVYKTDQAYAGREGVSLKLLGLDPKFNDNAENRAVVMHGGWYVEEDFIKKYGRAGRSWGCPALPLQSTAAIINTIKNNGIMVIYYPNEQWLATSKLLNCNKIITPPVTYTYLAPPSVQRKSVLLAMYGHNEIIVTMNAQDYTAQFHRKAPLVRMLRRQIEHSEYIALSQEEIKQLLALAKDDPDNQSIALTKLNFITPVVKMRRGYYITEMQKVALGKLTQIQANAADYLDTTNSYKFYFEPHMVVNFKLTHNFIRWLGL